MDLPCNSILADYQRVMEKYLCPRPMINQDTCPYEEYDLDEQDFQWLIAYNQYRIDKRMNRSFSKWRIETLST
jgi:hypothetical protein